MSSDAIFLKEHEVYQYFVQAGIKTPKFQLIDDAGDLNDSLFADGENIVIKGIANNLWHKSDEGALFFETYGAAKIKGIIDGVKKSLSSKYPDLQFLICEKIDFKKESSLPTEAFVSFKHDNSLGMTLNFGLGGIYAELWASRLSSGINQWAIGSISPKEAFNDFKEHLIGQIWLGEVRQGKALTKESDMVSFFESLWSLGKKLEEDGVELLEVNPLVLGTEGHPVVLDGVGLKSDKHECMGTIDYPSKELLNPKKIAIAGVSEKASSFGRKILENLLNSKLPKEDLRIIKPGASEFMGVECCQDVSALMENPVDMLILALPAPITVSMLTDLVKQGGGAKYVYIVAGGIGDGADKDNYAGKVKELLASRRKEGEWTPGILGPNSLGIVLGPNEINTLFLSPDRLPITFHEDGNTALVSQSGAFLITRLSSENVLPVKYGFAIGSQLDLKASDMLRLINEDSKISVFGFYFEGFEVSDALKFSNLAKELIGKGKHVVVYKGGRSESGMEAASGHTGAMAGNYDLVKRVFEKSGIIMAGTMEEFSTSLLLLSSYTGLKKSKSLVAVSNAGFEAVSCADHFGDITSGEGKNMLVDIKDKGKYQSMLEEHKLQGLVSPSNPMDLTPMADEAVFLKSTELLCSDFDIVVLSLVPFTERLDVFSEEAATQFVDSLAKIRDESGKVIIVVVDAGEKYDEYRQCFVKEGFPVFSSIERPMMVLGKLFC